MELIPVPMCTNHFGGDDRFYYRKLFRGHDRILRHMDESLLSRELKPSEYVEAFMRADIAVTMRYHALVFSLALGIPAIAIDYTLGKGKVFSLARKHSAPCAGLTDFTAAFMVDAFAEMLGGKHVSGASGKMPLFAGCCAAEIRRLLSLPEPK